jgi:hypothetical protein
MSDYTPVINPGQAWTSTASAAVTGGQLLAVSGSGTVAPAGAGATATLGVAAFDAPSGARVTIWPGVVHEVTAAAAVTAGQTLKAAANGQVTPWVSGTDAADLTVGTAITTAASGAKVRFFARY